MGRVNRYRVLEDARSAVWAPTPSQYRPPSTSRTPAHNLIAAILRQTLEDVTKRGRNAAEAKAWIMARGIEPFGFDWTCQVLGLEPTRLVAGLEAAPSWRRLRRH